MLRLAYPVRRRHGAHDGDNLPAAYALGLGLVKVLAEPGQALDVAIQLAQRITANGPLGVAAVAGHRRGIWLEPPVDVARAGQRLNADVHV